MSNIFDFESEISLSILRLLENDLGESLKHLVTSFVILEYSTETKRASKAILEIYSKRTCDGCINKRISLYIGLLYECLYHYKATDFEYTKEILNFAAGLFLKQFNFVIPTTLYEMNLNEVHELVKQQLKSKGTVLIYA